MCQRGPNPYSSHTQNPRTGSQPRLLPLPQPSSPPPPPPLLANSPLAPCSLQASPLGPQARFHPLGNPGPGVPRRSGARWGGGLGAPGHARREDSLIRASPPGGLLAPGPEELPRRERRMREGSREGRRGAGGRRRWEDRSQGCGWFEGEAGDKGTEGVRPRRGSEGSEGRGAPTGRARRLGRAPGSSWAGTLCPRPVPGRVLVSVPESSAGRRARQTLG